MLESDKVNIITSLEMLNNYIEKDLKETEENIEYWTGKIQEYGEDYVAHPKISNETYGEVLNRSLENKKYFIDKLDKSKRIIEMLKKGRKGKDETD